MLKVIEWNWTRRIVPHGFNEAARNGRENVLSAKTTGRHHLDNQDYQRKRFCAIAEDWYLFQYIYKFGNEKIESPSLKSMIVCSQSPLDQVLCLPFRNN